MAHDAAGKHMHPAPLTTIYTAVPMAGPSDRHLKYVQSQAPSEILWQRAKQLRRSVALDACVALSNVVLLHANVPSQVTTFPHSYMCALHIALK